MYDNGKKQVKRGIAIFLIIMMVFAMIPISTFQAFAQTESEITEQTGFMFKTDSPTELAYDETYQFETEGGSGTGAVTYAVTSGEDYVDVNADGVNGKVKVTGVGNVTIKATKAADNQYAAATATHTFTTVKANQTDFAFAEEKYEVAYGTKDITINAEGGQTQGSIKYSITEGFDIGSIDEDSGKITFETGKTGTMTVLAVKAGNEFYNEISGTVQVTVTRIDASDQYRIEGTQGENEWYIDDIEIIPAEAYQISQTDGFDAQWGDSLTIETEGITENYTFYLKSQDGSISDAITIDELKIDKQIPKTLEVSYSESVWSGILNAITFGYYKETATVNVKVEDEVSGISHITYDLGDGSGEKTIDSSQIANGETSFSINPQYKGTVVVTAYDHAGHSLKSDEKTQIVVDNVAPEITVSFDNNEEKVDNYYDAARTATIIIKEANFHAEDVLISVKERYDGSDYTERQMDDLTFQNGQEPGTYVATIPFTEDGDYILDVSYTDKSGNQAAGHNNDEFTIDTVNPVISYTGIENSEYYADDKELVLEIEEHNFVAADIDFVINAVDAEGTAVDLSAKAYEEYLQNQDSWTKEGDVHTAAITLDIEGNYSVEISYTDSAGREAINQFGNHFGFSIDKSVPDGLQVTYSTPAFEAFLNAITFGYYKEKVEVTLKATDCISGVDCFEYTYNVTDGSSTDNEGGSGTITTEKITYDGKEASASFEIPAPFKGTVSFTAIDKAGNRATYDDTNHEIVADDAAPEVTVKFPTDKAKNGNYYADKTTAVITIHEANFDADDVEIIVGKRLNKENKYTEGRISPSFQKGEGDIYTATYVFDEEADYTFDITYTDKSGNVFDDYAKYYFTVDKTAPKIAVTYDNNNVRNKTKFKSNRTAEIVIDEHNFHAKDVDVEISATNGKGESVSISDYESYLQNSENWKKSGDKYTAKITYTAEANYHFGIKYTDLAGIKNNGVTYGKNTQAPETFTIDKTKPTGAIKIGDWEEKWTGFPSAKEDNRSFGLWDKKTVQVTVASQDELSAIDYVEHFRSNRILSLNQVKQSNQWKKAALDRTGAFSYHVKPDERFVVYVHIVDKAGNERYLSSDGVIVDATIPSIENVAPEVTVKPKKQPVNGIYNTDVLIDVAVKDPVKGKDIFSGLRSVTYKVYNYSNPQGERVTQEGTLYTFSKQAPQKNELVQMYEKSAAIAVDREKNNSNVVVVEVKAVDNSGNVKTKTCKLKIDTTRPTIDVSYDNNDVDSRTHFSDSRTATIVVTERNFNPDDVKVTITNTEADIPSLTSWEKVQGTGNLDDTKWKASVTYKADGDYTFDIKYTDKAGNVGREADYGKNAAPTAFTIDKTKPTVSVSYNNNAARNGKYFNAPRTATIVVREHNFDVERVEFMQTASLNGRAIGIPSASWSSQGDVHTARIAFTADGDYTFDVVVHDKAGNQSSSASYGNSVAGKDFVIDQTIGKPVLGGVQDQNAYKGTVIPTISLSDVNYDSYDVQLLRTRAGEQNVDVTAQFISAIAQQGQGASGAYDTFEEIAENDGIYTLTVKMMDKAGNEESEEITFTVNRFGSVYRYSNYLASLIKDGGQYVTVTGKNKSAITQDLVITEYNADRLLEGSLDILITRDGEAIDAKYTTTPSVSAQAGIGGSGWYEYVYRIAAENFKEDGVYKIALSSAYATSDADESESSSMPENSTDAAGNQIVDNMAFTVDTKAPEIRNVVNLDEAVVDAESLEVSYTIVDVGGLKSIQVLLNGKPHEEAVAGFEANSFSYSGKFTIEDGKKAQTVQIIATDVAGNVTDTASKDFDTQGLYVFNDEVTVSTNFFVLWYARKPLFWGSIGGAVALLGAAYYFITRKRRENE